MDVNRASLHALQEGFRKLFAENLKEPASQESVAALCSVVPTRNKKETFAWLSRLGRMREWVGERQLNGFEAYTYDITVKKYEYTVAVERDDIEDDNLALYRPQILEMAQETNDNYARLVADAMIAGFTTECFDGQYFFDTDHPINGLATTFGNKATAVLSETALQTAFNNLPNITDDQGNPLGIYYDTLICHPALRFTAKKLVEAEMFVQSSVLDYNPVRGIVSKIIYDPLLSSSTAWFLLDSRRAIKPLVMLLRTNPEFTALDSPDNPEVFMKEKFYYGVRARHAVGYGLPHVIYGSTGAG